MSYSYEQLEKMTVAELRKIAEGLDHEAVHGYLTMHKEKLIPALCVALGIEMHKHHKATAQNKTAMKQKVRQLKKFRDEAIAAHDYGKLVEVRKEIHDLKIKLRHAAQ
ncbi:MAG: hypothetical protein KBG83_04585 [Bacteroidetes bacterium]|jgi:protein-arginine kinase activator protein McsA|nr:hypothetical protein [Bacteroidota bacterium]